jgi:hypothetical protein
MTSVQNDRIVDELFGPMWRDAVTVTYGYADGPTIDRFYSASTPIPIDWDATEGQLTFLRISASDLPEFSQFRYPMSSAARSERTQEQFDLQLTDQLGPALELHYDETGVWLGAGVSTGPTQWDLVMQAMRHRYLDGMFCRSAAPARHQPVARGTTRAPASRRSCEGRRRGGSRSAGSRDDGGGGDGGGQGDGGDGPPSRWRRWWHSGWQRGPLYATIAVLVGLVGIWPVVFGEDHQPAVTCAPPAQYQPLIPGPELPPPRLWPLQDLDQPETDGAGHGAASP